MAGSQLLRAVSSFATTIGKTEYFVRQGEVLRADHPAVKGRRELFEPALPVEQATAAPGEKRQR
jgi:hypothetical protein